MISPARADIDTLYVADASISNSYALQTAEDQLISIFQENIPSVVYINTFVERIDAFSMDVTEVPAGAGTGFVWDKDGHIVTNYHVIKNSQSAKVSITRPDGKSMETYNAKVVGIDPDKDVAVLEIDDKNDNLLVDGNRNNRLSWTPIKLGTSNNLRVGQTALAIGNPFGLDHTLTTGIVSGLGREVRSPSNRPIYNVIQTDAAINPGNSGGPLLDSKGRLIGMNTAIYSMSGASAGIGFAIPVDTLSYEVNTLIKEGVVTRPGLGISYLESTQAKLLGVNNGILVLSTTGDNSPAKLAGIKETYRDNNGNIMLGDIVVGIDDDKIASESDLFRSIEKYKVGDIISLKVIRDEKLNKNNIKQSNNDYNNKIISLSVKLTAMNNR
eukprot:gene7865-10674_t